MQTHLFSSSAAQARLTAWWAQRLPGASDVVVTGVEHLAAGHSNDTFAVELAWQAAGTRQHQSVILRTPPSGVGLLAPYDVARQFRIMQALAGSAVPVPRMHWLEEGTEVLGRPFFVMDKLDGACIEKEVPADILAAAPQSIRQLCERYIDLIAQVHRLDWRARGLGFLGDGVSYLSQEIAKWEAEIRRHQQGELPAFERLLGWLKQHRPTVSSPATLVHGDAKIGNLFLRGQEVVALFDWEMAGIGDPLTDLGWASLQWHTPSALLSNYPGALTRTELLARYEHTSGITVHDLPFYEGLAGLKLCAILFIASMLYRTGQSTDPRFLRFGNEVLPKFLEKVLKVVGIEEAVPCGDVAAVVPA
ncbi:MAG: phosphotransferase family protein [Burkholderiales bacterium]